jgi:hypothetical protein
MKIAAIKATGGSSRPASTGIFAEVKQVEGEPKQVPSVLKAVLGLCQASRPTRKGLVVVVVAGVVLPAGGVVVVAPNPSIICGLRS